MAAGELNMRILVHVWAVAETSRARVESNVEEVTRCAPEQFRVMQLIDSSIENVTATELARLMRCSKAKVSYVVRQLGMRGWVRCDAVYGDARSMILRLSDSGRAVYEGYREALVWASNALLEDLDDEERQRLVSIFKKIARGSLEPRASLECE